MRREWEEVEITHAEAPSLVIISHCFKRRVYLTVMNIILNTVHCIESSMHATRLLLLMLLLLFRSLGSRTALASSVALLELTELDGSSSSWPCIARRHSWISRANGGMRRDRRFGHSCSTRLVSSLRFLPAIPVSHSALLSVYMCCTRLLVYEKTQQPHFWSPGRSKWKNTIRMRRRTRCNQPLQ